ncbi:MAG: hypothetical protein AAF732_11165 [Pseudomonadota bacterium]
MSDNPDKHHDGPPSDPSWFERPGTVRLILWALYIACAGVFVADIAIPKHGPFAIEYIFGFYAIYGFVGCVGLVLAAKELRRLLMRPEDYYDR